MIVYLIRHGQKTAQTGDPGLTELGKQQAIETGLYLKQFNVDRIVSSPYKRTVETAINIAQVLKMDFSQHNSLVERLEWPNTNMSRLERIREWVKASQDRHYVSEFGNSSYDTGKRVEEFVDSLGMEEKQVVVVTHGGAIVDYLRNVFGDQKLKHLKTDFGEGNYDYHMTNCAINKVIFKPQQKPILDLLEYTEHLSKLSD